MVQEPTSFEARSGSSMVDPLIRPKFGKVNKLVTDVSATSPETLVVAFHFSPLNVYQTGFQGRTVDSPYTLFSLLLLIY